MADRPRTRVAVLISGRGSNMAALLYASRAAACPYEVALVVANDPDAPGLALAAAEGVPVFARSHKGLARAAFDDMVDAELRRAGVGYVALAGYMRLLSPGFVRRWEGRMINIHPSLLPLFRGTHTHARALAAGVRLHGCTVHYVVPELDAGPIVAQAAVPVREGDDADGLAARVVAQEHRLYPAALALVAGGRARLEGGRAVVEAEPPDGALLSL